MSIQNISTQNIITTALLTLGLLLSGTTQAASKLAVNITPELAGVDVNHGGRNVHIMRNQNQGNTISPAFAKTSRKCPPFCVQPAVIAPGVETIAEREVLHYLKRMKDGDKSILVIDSRTPDWAARGTIPGSVNIPWTKLNPAKGADPISIGEILEGTFSAFNIEGLWDYSNAKTLVMFCNGMWCGQSPNNIKNLLKFGYPAHKIKWYRGGMQSWEILGLTTVKALK
ncbi:MAG: rhodanese-like domain-containing protein [Gammaproteobacteria bacterium]|nr:rhodanese-like domain-containing protein [Gammaproteobacteria bacterium]